MLLKSWQKTTPLEVEEPKITVRNYLNQTVQSKSSKEQRSRCKSPSIKYLKQIETKMSKQKSCKNLGNNILQLLENYQQNLKKEGQINFRTLSKDLPQASKIVKSQKLNSQRTYCSSNRNEQIKYFNDQKANIQESMIEKLQSNETKIILMRQNLQKIFNTYKQTEKEINKMKSAMKNKDKIKLQNQFLIKEINNMQKMIKQTLLEREKIKYGPFNHLTKKNKK